MKANLLCDSLTLSNLNRAHLLIIRRKSARVPRREIPREENERRTHERKTLLFDYDLRLGRVPCARFDCEQQQQIVRLTMNGRAALVLITSSVLQIC